MTTPTIEIGGLDIVEPADDREAYNLAAFTLAKDYDAFVDFRYAKGTGTVVEDRTVQPQSIQKLRDGNILILSYDGDREDIRAYRLDRVRGFAAVSR